MNNTDAVTTFSFSKTERGFEKLEFKDCYGAKCELAQSSGIMADTEDAFNRPGSSAIWLGVEDADPMVMASQAASVGVETDATCGWVPYPIPKEVLLITRMHLNREKVVGLIVRLQGWLDNGSFENV